MPGHYKSLLLRTLLVLFPGAGYANTVLATSCAWVSSTLQEDYDRADHIILAQASGCADRSLPENGFCPDLKFSFSVLEILKDAGPARDYGDEFQGADIMGCGMYFTIGHNYLLFIDNSGQLIHAAGGYLSGDDFRTISAEKRLKILRQFRDGVVADLSEPWKFTDTGISCSVEHRFKGGDLRFLYNYTGSNYEPMEMDISRGPDGEMQYDAKPYPPGREPPKIEFTGPIYDRNTVIFSISLADHKQMVEGTTSVEVDNRVWPMHRMTIEILSSGSSEHTSHMGVTGGDPAKEIFEAMSQLADVAISAIPKGMGPVPLAETPVRFETKTTQFPTAAKRFRACVDGTERRGSPQLP